MDEAGVKNAMRCWAERDTSLDVTIYGNAAERLVKGSHNKWKSFNMLGPGGECLPCREAMPLHAAANTGIILWQENPKAKGTMSHTRYEKYKVACTFQEMLDLGAKR